MKSTLISIFALSVITFSSFGQTTQSVTGSTTESIFPVGEKIDISHFSAGEAYVNYLLKKEEVYDTQIASVHYLKNARTKWHFHPAGQILIVLSGTGYHQIKGKPKDILKHGDMVKCPPNTPHWHGSSPTDPVHYMVINPNIAVGAVQWLEEVPDEVYKK